VFASPKVQAATPIVNTNEARKRSGWHLVAARFAGHLVQVSIGILWLGIAIPWTIWITRLSGMKKYGIEPYLGRCFCLLFSLMMLIEAGCRRQPAEATTSDEKPDRAKVRTFADRSPRGGTVTAPVQPKTAANRLGSVAAQPDPLAELEETKFKARQGDATAQYKLGMMYAQGQGVPRDSGEAMRWFLAAANQGDAKAQLQVAQMYSTGNGVAKDESVALGWYLRSAEQGEAEAQYEVGTMYAFGRGSTLNDDEAVKWHLKAAEQGFAPAQYSMALRYSRGRGVHRDDATALQLFQRAAEQGFAPAQYTIAGRYLNGRGVSQDGAAAAVWYGRAADQGHAESQFNIGMMYLNGQGIQKEEAVAAEYLIKAAKQNYADAQAALGSMYELGKGLAQDRIEAYKWYLLSAKNGNNSVEKQRELLAGRMTPAEMAEGQRRAEALAAGKSLARPEQ
jgi:TPR repeat protein